MGEDRREFRGLVAATFTPMHDDGRLRLELVPEIVIRLLERGISGLYVCGSTGEGPLLTDDERRAVAAAYVDAAAGRVPVAVQVGHASVRASRDLADHAQAVGANAVSATPPTYFRPASPTDVVACMAEVASAAPSLPFFYYHIPEVTGVRVDVAEVLAQGAEKVPNLAGVKFSSPAVFEFANVDLARFDVLFGVDEMLISGLVAGAHGAVGSTYNLIPEVYRQAMEALAGGDMAAAQRHQRTATQLVLRVIRGRSLPFLKAAMEFTGLPVGPTRLPLRSVDAAELACLRDDLLRTGWLAAFTGGVVEGG
jgi:N-acetylneuraminate lyase